MTILEKITTDKRLQVARDRRAVPIAELERRPGFVRERLSLAGSIRRPDRSGIIAEYKRHSPSKGYINRLATVEQVTDAYARHGASGISVLTDEPYFKGTAQDLIAARTTVGIPLLRKEFVVEDYQIVEAAALGADAILLIAECLTAPEVRDFARLARQLDLEVLMEIHSEAQLDKWTPDIGLIGVNNRDLKTFEVSVENSVRLFPQLPTEAVRISESGISEPATIRRLREVGFEGFLIGEQFMKSDDPGRAFASFIEDV